MQKQYLLLVDDNDHFSGIYKEKESCHTGKGFHHRAFVVCLFNKKGEILLQHRKHKRWDKFWDVTAISHVLHLENHDEDYKEAAARSLNTELGIENVILKKIGGFNYLAKYKRNMCENEYCAILIGEFDGEIKPNMNVIYGYKWIKKEDFINDCRKNSKIYAPWTILTAETLGQYFNSKTIW